MNQSKLAETLVEGGEGLHRRGFAGRAASLLALIPGLGLIFRDHGKPVSFKEAAYYENADGERK